MFTITDLFDYKQELDELLSRIGKHVEIWFSIALESPEDGEITNEGYVNDINQVKSCLSDVFSSDFADEVFEALDSSDLYISSNGELDYNTLIPFDEANYEVSYVIQLTIV